MKKQPLIADEFRNFKGNAVKISPFRANITPRGIEKFNEADESITYKRGEALWYKAYSKAEPEILAFKDLAIWYYHELVADIDVNGEQYRIFYNSIAKKFFANQIINEDGNFYLKNTSCNEKFIEALMEFAKGFAAPENEKSRSINVFVTRWKKEKLKEKSKSRFKLKRRGRKEEEYLKEATLWVINNRQQSELTTETARRAYEIFKTEAQSESAFVKSVTNKCSRLEGIYKAKSVQYKKRTNFKAYAKKSMKPIQTKAENH